MNEKEKEKEEIVREHLDALNVKSIEELPDEMIVGIMSLTTDVCASVIYEESNEEERKQFIEDSKRCINGDADIESYMVNREGVKTEDNEDYFDWTSRHSMWYRLIAIP